MEVELLISNDTHLGEGPVWDYRFGVLYWVDILKGNVQAFEYASGTNRVLPMGSFTGAVVPTTGSSLLVALQNQIALLDPATGKLETFCEPEPGRASHRFNDGKCDPLGQFWIGSTEVDHQNPTGALYRVSSDGSFEVILDQVHISNGLAWSPDSTRMYFIDSPTQKVKAFDFSEEKGVLSNESVALNLTEEKGVPDGMCIDTEGNLWVAFYGGGKVACFDPENGKCLDEIKVPAKNTTSCCFGGPELDELFITTAKRDDPQGGGLYRYKPGVSGPKVDLFRL